MSESGSHVKTIPLDDARWKLTRIWLIWVFLMIGFLFLLSVRAFEESHKDLWTWALPTFVPITTLILTVLGSTAMEPLASDFTVRKNYYRLACYLMIGYFGLTIATLVVQCFKVSEELTFLKASNVWIQTMQGFVMSALSVVFFSKQPSTSARKVSDIKRPPSDGANSRS